MAKGWNLAVHGEYDGRSRRCTIGLHPGEREDFGECADGSYAKTQCCELTPCMRHKCGPRKGCRCPLPNESTVVAAPQADVTGGGES